MQILNVFNFCTLNAYNGIIGRMESKWFSNQVSQSFLSASQVSRVVHTICKVYVLRDLVVVRSPTRATLTEQWRRIEDRIHERDEFPRSTR